MGDLENALYSLMNSLYALTGNIYELDLGVTQECMYRLQNSIRGMMQYDRFHSGINLSDGLIMQTAYGPVHIKVKNYNDVSKLEARIKELEHTLNTMDEKEEKC